MIKQHNDVLTMQYDITIEATLQILQNSNSRILLNTTMTHLCSFKGLMWMYMTGWCMIGKNSVIMGNTCKYIMMWIYMFDFAWGV